MTVTFLYLILAIALEVIGTSAMQASQQFTKLAPTILMAVSYAAAFYFLAMSLKTIPVGIAYAIWSGLGIVLISLIGRFYFGQMLDTPALLGLALIIAGVLVINLFSKSIGH